MTKLYRVIKKEKKNKSGVTVDNNMSDYSNDPLLKRKQKLLVHF